MTPYEQQRAVVDALSARLADQQFRTTKPKAWDTVLDEWLKADARLTELATDPAPSCGGACWECGKPTFPALTSTGRDCADGCTARVDTEVRCAA